jgi:hypothetical protein
MRDGFPVRTNSHLRLVFAFPIPLACCFILLATTPRAVAQDFLEDTFLLNVSLGSHRSEIAQDLTYGGYELSDGTPVDFVNWYTPRFPELNVLFLTQINPAIGMTWGVSLGEEGVKYRIDPGVWIGLVYRRELGRQSSLTFSAVTLLGGNFRERTCIGDYGDIGGIQVVNCRLAASVLPPAQTLDFLINERGYLETRVSVRYSYRF